MGLIFYFDPSALVKLIVVEDGSELASKPAPFVDAWRSGEIEDTPENAEVALEAQFANTCVERFGAVIADTTRCIMMP